VKVVLPVLSVSCTCLCIPGLLCPEPLWGVGAWLHVFWPLLSLYSPASVLGVLVSPLSLHSPAAVLGVLVSLYVYCAVTVPGGHQESWQAGSEQGPAEFRTEVEVLSRIRHPHIVLLLMGSCPAEACTVYEFLAGGPPGTVRAARQAECTPGVPWVIPVWDGAGDCLVLPVHAALVVAGTSRGTVLAYQHMALVAQCTTWVLSRHTSTWQW